MIISLSLLRGMVSVLIDELVKATVKNWEKVGFKDTEFSSVAEQSFHDVNLANQLSAKDVLREFIPDDYYLPIKIDGHGSKDIIVLRKHGHFNVLAHLWTDDLAPLHCHTWGGAYQMIEGTSLGGQFDFEVTKELSHKYYLGNLETKNLNFFHAGHVQKVTAGFEYVHGLSYTTRIGCAISIRRPMMSANETYTIFRPFLGVRVSDPNTVVESLLKAIPFMAETYPEEIEAYLWEVVQNAPLHIFYAVAAKCIEEDIPVSAKILDFMRKKFGEDFDQLWESLFDIKRYKAAVQSRASVNDADNKLLTSILFFSENYETTKGLLKKIRPDINLELFICLQIAKNYLEMETSKEVPQPILFGIYEMLKKEKIATILQKVAEKYSTERHLKNYLNILPELYKQLLANPIFKPLFHTKNTTQKLKEKAYAYGT